MSHKVFHCLWTFVRIEFKVDLPHSSVENNFISNLLSSIHGSFITCCVFCIFPSLLVEYISTNALCRCWKCPSCDCLLFRFYWFSLSEEVESVLLISGANKCGIYVNKLGTLSSKPDRSLGLLGTFLGFPLIQGNLQEPFSTLYFPDQSHKSASFDVQNLDSNRGPKVKESISLVEPK